MQPEPSNPNAASQIDREDEARRDTSARVERARADFGLTVREAEVLELLAMGEPTKIVADRLGCAMRTVEAHATSIFRKAGVGSRAVLLVKFWTR